jgi:hypothetical protein
MRLVELHNLLTAIDKIRLGLHKEERGTLLAPTSLPLFQGMRWLNG